MRGAAFAGTMRETNEADSFEYGSSSQGEERLGTGTVPCSHHMLENEAADEFIVDLGDSASLGAG